MSLADLPAVVCMGGDPPACCQPLSDAEWAERTARLRAAQERSVSNLPTRCPACGSGAVAPLFWLDADTWDCGRCGAIFSERA